MAGPVEEENEGRGFKVIDRRGAAQAEAAAEPEAAARPPRPPQSAPKTERPAQAGELPKIDFPTFVLSLFTSALYQMGLAPDPASGERAGEPNLLVARQTIDTLELLEVKTRGNLDPEEANLLENALFELRMRFVELSK